MKVGTPNACTNCHRNKTSQWASDSIDKWYGHASKGFQRFAEVIDAGSTGAPGALQSLAGLVNDREQPAIARATALSMIAPYNPSPTDPAIHVGVTNDSALLKRAAASALANSDPTVSAPVLAPRLNDPVRAVRIETAQVLAGLLANSFPADIAAALARGTDEYIAAQELNADRPEAHMNLGLLYKKENRASQAEEQFKTAMLLDPAFAPAAVDLADLYRAQNRDQAGEVVLQRAIGRSPNDASLRHAYGLLLVRQRRSDDALKYLAAASRIEPDNARYAYVYAVALNDAGQPTAAIAVLEACLAAHPYDRNALGAIVSFLRRAGDPAKALGYAQRLAEVEPEDTSVREAVKALDDQVHHNAP